MTSGITIELAGEHDWERVRSIRLAALQDTPDAFFSTFEHESIQPSEWWQGRLRSKLAATLLAVCGQRDAGITVVALDGEQGDAWVSAVWVAPAYRGQGVGDALMAAAMEFARGLGMRRLVLEVAETNTPAQAFYLRHRFTKTGRLSSLPPPREDRVEVEFALDL